MPPKRKQTSGPVTECPITGFPIDGRLKKRLKSSTNVTAKTISNALQSNFGEKVAIGAGVEIDGLIDIYYETLLANKAASPEKASAKSPSPAPVPPPRSSRKAAAPVASPAAPKTPPSKPPPKRSSARSDPAEDMPSPKHISSPAKPVAASNSKEPAKKASKKAAKKGGGPSITRAFCWLAGIITLVAVVLAAAVTYGGPEVQKMLPPALATHLEIVKASGAQLQKVGVESYAKDNYNWVVDNAAKLGKDAMLTAGVYGNQMQAKVEGWISGLSGGKAAPADDKAQVKERLLREIEARQKAEREAKWRLEAEAAAAAEAEAAAAEQAAASESQHEAEPAGVGAAEGASDDGGAQEESVAPRSQGSDASEPTEL